MKELKNEARGNAKPHKNCVKTAKIAFCSAKAHFTLHLEGLGVEAKLVIECLCLASLVPVRGLSSTVRELCLYNLLPLWGLTGELRELCLASLPPDWGLSGVVRELCLVCREGLASGLSGMVRLLGLEFCLISLEWGLSGIERLRGLEIVRVRGT